MWLILGILIVAGVILVIQKNDNLWKFISSCFKITFLCIFGFLVYVICSPLEETPSVKEESSLTPSIKEESSSKQPVKKKNNRRCSVLYRKLHPEKCRPTKKIKVSARKLANDYHANEFAADIKYEQAIITVRGKVEDVGKILWDNYVILYGNIYLDVRCTFNRDQIPKLASLKKNQKVTFECVSGIGLLLGEIHLTDCSVIK